VAYALFFPSCFRFKAYILFIIIAIDKRRILGRISLGIRKPGTCPGFFDSYRLLLLADYLELGNHALLGALATLAACLLSTTVILFEAGGTIAAVAQFLYQPPFFTEATRSSIAGS
jgi:hypothetical protein